jgi:iron complex outermembrane receptor protein
VGGFAQYTAAVPGGDLTLRADVKWTDDYRTEINYFDDKANWRITEIESFTLVDARAAYALTDSNIEVALWGKNLTDEEYPMHTIPFLGNGFSIYAPPRTYGVSVSWKSR